MNINGLNKWEDKVWHMLHSPLLSQRVVTSTPSTVIITFTATAPDINHSAISAKSTLY